MLKFLSRCVSSLEFFKEIALPIVLFFGLGQQQDVNTHDILEQTKDFFPKEVKDLLKFPGQRFISVSCGGSDNVGSIAAKELAEDVKTAFNGSQEICKDGREMIKMVWHQIS